MQLSGPLFGQIAGTLEASGRERTADGASATDTADPRRREPRLGVQARVTLIPLTAGDSLAAGPVTVPLRDLSAGGIGFLHTGRINLDEQFVVLLPHGASGDSVAVLCQVANYQPLADRLYAVGARFVRVLRQPVADDATGPATLSLPAPQDAARRRAAS